MTTALSDKRLAEKSETNRIEDAFEVALLTLAHDE
jgi:hypothetical protein